VCVLEESHFLKLVETESMLVALLPKNTLLLCKPFLQKRCTLSYSVTPFIKLGMEHYHLYFFQNAERIYFRITPIDIQNT
jgi:hypothetical protein